MDEEILKNKNCKIQKLFKTKQRKTQKYKTLILKAPLAITNRMLKGNVKLKTLKEPLAVSGVFYPSSRVSFSSPTIGSLPRPIDSPFGNSCRRRGTSRHVPRHSSRCMSRCQHHRPPHHRPRCSCAAESPHFRGPGTGSCPAA